MTSIYEAERKAVEGALLVLRSLAPFTPRSESQLTTLRKASATARLALGQGFSSAAALIDVRDAAAAALDGVTGLGRKGSLTREVIDRPTNAAEAWLKDLVPLWG
jgi:hypothetical protein